MTDDDYNNTDCCKLFFFWCTCSFIDLLLTNFPVMLNIDDLKRPQTPKIGGGLLNLFFCDFGCLAQFLLLSATRNLLHENGGG